MAEHNLKPASLPPLSRKHKDELGRDCACLIVRDHHKDAKNADCTCKTGMNHNTKPSPHKDRDGRDCHGQFTFETKVPLHGKRFCSWCQREEFYSPVEITVIFKKGVSEVSAVKFMMDFKLNAETPVIVNDQARGIVTKKDMVAITVAIPGPSPEAWVAEFEKCQDLIAAAMRVMVVRFTNYDALVERPKVQKSGKITGEDFPKEFSGV